MFSTSPVPSLKTTSIHPRLLMTWMSIVPPLPGSVTTGTTPVTWKEYDVAALPAPAVAPEPTLVKSPASQATVT